MIILNRVRGTTNKKSQMQCFKPSVKYPPVISMWKFMKYFAIGSTYISDGTINSNVDADSFQHKLLLTVALGIIIRFFIKIMQVGTNKKIQSNN